MKIESFQMKIEDSFLGIKNRKRLFLMMHLLV